MKLREEDICLDERSQNLLTPGKNNEEYRIIVVVDHIVKVVKATHIGNDHLGWDAT